MWVAVPFVMNGKIDYHAFGNEKLPAVIAEKVGILLLRDFPRNGKHDPSGKPRVPLFFNRFCSIP